MDGKVGLRWDVVAAEEEAGRGDDREGFPDGEEENGEKFRFWAEASGGCTEGGRATPAEGWGISVTGRTKVGKSEGKGGRSEKAISDSVAISSRRGARSSEITVESIATEGGGGGRGEGEGTEEAEGGGGKLNIEEKIEPFGLDSIRLRRTETRQKEEMGR